MFILKKGHQPGVYVPLRALFLVFAVCHKNIRIHHECSCRIGKSHPRGRNFKQGRGKASASALFEIPTLG